MANRGSATSRGFPPRPWERRRFVCTGCRFRREAGRRHISTRHHETALYVSSGEAHTWYGEGLREHVVVKAGEFFYIPAGMPHLPANLSEAEPCVAVIARTDPNEQENVVLLPELDGVLSRI